MFQSQFESRFSTICGELASTKGNYDFRTAEDVWKDIGTNPRDVAFIELSELYIQADDAQRKRIFDEMATDSARSDIWYFIRRMGKQIHSKDDTKWLQVGITAALIDGARGDFRDLGASLELLRFAAELQGIDTKPFFDQAMQSADEKTVWSLRDARDQTDSDVHFAVQTWGAPEWVAESVKKYGEHPSIIKKIDDTKFRENTKELKTGLRNVIVFVILAGLLFLLSYIRSLMGR